MVRTFFPGTAFSCRSLEVGEGSSQGEVGKPGEREAPWACCQNGVPSGHAISLGNWGPERKECFEGFCSPAFPNSLGRQRPQSSLLGLKFVSFLQGKGNFSGN